MQYKIKQKKHFPFKNKNAKLSFCLHLIFYPGVHTQVYIRWLMGNNLTQIDYEGTATVVQPGLTGDQEAPSDPQE